MLTGRYHSRGGVYSTSAGGERLDLDETTLADVFKTAGYATAAYGKWHNGMQYPYHPNGRGFDDYYGFCSGHWGNYYSPMLEHNQQIVTGEGFVIDDFTNHGLEFIEKNRERPFLLYLPFNTPHAPMQVPDRWWDKQKVNELTMFADDDKEEDPEFTKAALAMCENIDWNVGRIMQKLQELDLEDNTIVLYFNDNGPNSWRWNGGMRGRKGSTDEGGVRTPLFVKWPSRISPGKQIMEVAAVMDLLPTLADLAGIECNTNKPLDGKSLKRLLTEEPAPWDDRIIFNQWRERVSARNQRFRLDHQGNLYDIENDRGQTTDVSEAFPEIKQLLEAAKMDYQNEVMSELPEEDTRTFPLGHPDARITQIPARDGVAHGNIVRSNRWPNCSFFTNWISLEDKITWEVEVLETGDYEVVLYYTCKMGDEGSEFELSFGDSKLEGRIEEAHDPPLTGMEHDRVERPESYVKDFKALNLGRIYLNEGVGQLALQATVMPGKSVMDVRLMLFEPVR
jgi:arylsulfatase A-like enzyme